MTKWLQIFLALYILVGQPAIIWWMLWNTELYQLAWLNAWVFLIAWIISAICKPSKKNKKTIKKDEKVEEKDEKEDIEMITSKADEIIEKENQKNSEESIGEDEKEIKEKQEKSMKETVSIPKIVQPISGHTTAKKRRKRERKWWQRLILLLTLWIAAVVMWTLWEFLECWWIAIALFLWWILYLIIWKLFDVNWFYNAKKLFTNWLYIVLIFAWIGYWVYVSQHEETSFNVLPEWWWNKVIEYVKDLFKSEEVESQANTWAIYIFEWTWEVIVSTWENNAEIEDGLWETLDVQESDGQETVLEQEDVVEGNAEDEWKILTDEEAKKQVTMWEAIKFLLSWVTLSSKTTSTFKYVAKSNELYPYFKTAQEKWMIWTDTDPSKIISCETYITMKWLAEGWNVWSYVKSEIKTAYWKKASELWKLNWCTKWSYVTKGNL